MVLTFHRTENLKVYLILVQTGPSSKFAVRVYALQLKYSSKDN